jgi:ABC-2 type transport system ATP-binding protein
MSIEIKQVTKIYGQQKALDDVSFTIETGKIIGFLGPNGAGKSTLMKIITGFIPATKGEVFVEGIQVSDSSMDVRKLIGYLPENNPLYTDMYVKEYLTFIAGIYKLDRVSERVDQMIEKTGLTLEYRKKIGQLSKGYRQRVGLAQALIHDPKVLILDEPTSGLDPNQIIEIRNLIGTLGHEKTIMLSTHIMQEVQAICDRIVIINRGRLVADGTAETIQQQVSEGKQVLMVEFSNPVDNLQLKQISGVLTVEPVRNNICLIESAKQVDIRQDIFQFAVKNNLMVLTMQLKEKSLEEVFKELTTAEVKN